VDLALAVASVMNRVLLQIWAVVFVVLCVCPFTAPFSTFDVAGPHDLVADNHAGVASTKLASDESAIPAITVIAFMPGPVEPDMIRGPQVHQTVLFHPNTILRI
jgi:hypothetical protein